MQHQGIAEPDYRRHAAEVWPVFLPVVSMRDTQPLYLEALARTDLECGHQHLIAVAESRQFVGEIDCSMLGQAITLLRSIPGICVGVNVSAVTLRRGVERWLRQLASAPDVASRLVVELTEAQVFDSLDRLFAFVSASRHFGVRFALDDYEFGSFGDDLVHRVSPDIIKLSDVWGGGVDQAKSRIEGYLEKMSEFGVSDVVLEQVDAAWKLDLVSHLRVPYAQGFIVSPHLTVTELRSAFGNVSVGDSVATEPLFAVCR